MIARPLRLGVNIDHVATVRNARGGALPDPVRAAEIAAAAGADGITLHIREDRRHVREDDLERLAARVRLPINLEMACADEMLAIALAARPHAVCLVPERREERTTEGGLEVASRTFAVAPYVERLAAAGSRVSLFIEPDAAQVRAAAEIGASVVELHTGAYCDAEEGRRASELARLQRAAEAAAALGLEVHAGHGLTYETVTLVAAIPEVAELNIGHFLIGEAIFVGLGPAIVEMKRRMATARGG